MQLAFAFRTISYGPVPGRRILNQAEYGEGEDVREGGGELIQREQKEREEGEEDKPMYSLVC